MMCGNDLRQVLNQQTLDEITVAGAKIINARARFWKIEKQGIAPSWLLGTMHASDAVVVAMSQAEKQAFENADRVILELREITDETGSLMRKAVMSDATIALYQDDNSIKKQLTEAQFQQFETVLNKRGFSYSAMQRMKPWLIWSALARQNCASVEGQALLKPFDMQLGLAALQQGKELIGLETPQEQILAITQLPDKFFIKSIIEIIANEQLIKDQFTTMGKLYVERNIGDIVALFDYYSEKNFTSAERKQFHTVFINDRNVLMAQRVKPFLENGNNFIAVGILHLVDENGLVEILRKMGYQVTIGE